MSFVLIGIFLLLLFDGGETKCPALYNDIATGCYKIMNGLTMTWSDAKQNCSNESSLVNGTNGSTTHLVALEMSTERTALLYWMNAWNLRSPFWIDGVVSSSTWDWSNQSITWFFNSTELDIIGNGSNYKLDYDPSNVTNITYQIADDINSKLINFICEYQELCVGNTSCLNNATCYFNMGQQLCVCAPGYTGQLCDTNIDDCLSSPCQHGGTCIDAVNNYTCDCSNIFYNGTNCQIPTADPTQSERTAAFWSVVGVVSGLVAILTLSDLPWKDILNAIGCSCNCLKCCSNQDDDEDTNEKNLRLSDSPTNDHNLGAKKMSMPDGITSKGMNYHVMNTVWNPEHVHTETATVPQYNGYRSPDPSTTPDNALIQSFAAVVMAKQKQQDIDDKRVYAVNINEPTKSTSKDPADTMVSWTQQLQEELRNKKSRETSASSTKQLIHSSKTNDY